MGKGKNKKRRAGNSLVTKTSSLHATKSAGRSSNLRVSALISRRLSGTKHRKQKVLSKRTIVHNLSERREAIEREYRNFQERSLGSKREEHRNSLSESARVMDRMAQNRKLSLIENDKRNNVTQSAEIDDILQEFQNMHTDVELAHFNILRNQVSEVPDSDSIQTAKEAPMEHSNRFSILYNEEDEETLRTPMMMPAKLDAAKLRAFLRSKVARGEASNGTEELLARLESINLGGDSDDDL